MAAQRASLPRAALLLLVAVHLLPTASACYIGAYEQVINELCLAQFKYEMAGLDRDLWCSWPDTSRIYEGLTNCTYQVALKVECFWPNRVVDRFFMQIHRTYFHDCALTGRLIHDPPVAVLAPFIAVPILITLFMTALVVWRSKRTEGVL